MDAIPDHNPIHHNVDIVAELLIECRGGVELIEFPVHLHTLKSLLAQLQKLFAVFALPVTHNRREQVSARPFFKCERPVNHILHLLRLDRQAGCR